MSGLGRKRVSKWDSKEDAAHHHPHSLVNAKQSSYYRDKEPEPVRFNGESNSNRRSTASDDQHSGEARNRSRVAQNNDDSYYSEQDDRQHFYRRSGSRSNSRSRSRSRSRSPVYRGRRDTGSYDRHKTRTRDSPLSNREFNKRATDNQFDQSSDYGWDDRLRKPRETNYHTDDFREQPMTKGVRSSDYNTDFSEDHSRRELLHDGVPDSKLRRHRSEFAGGKETQRRDGSGEGEFHRSSNIPCKFFAAGFCRNGKYCRFSHHGSDRKPPQDNNFCRQDNDNYSGHNKWSDVERLDNGKLGGIEISRVSKGIPDSKGNGSGWIDDMEMSPDWDYGVQSLKNPVKEEHGVGNTGQSSQSRVLKDDLVTNYDRKSSGMFLHGSKTVEKPLTSLHQNYSNPVNVPPVQAFNQNHNAVPYQSSLTAGGSQQVPAAAATDFSVGSNLSNLESGQVYQNNHHSTVEKPALVQNTVSKEQIDQISNISATLVQFLSNGQPIPQLKQALQLPLHSESSMAIQPNQATTALHAQSNTMSSNPNQLWGLGMSTGSEGVPAVTASQVSNIDGTQVLELNTKVSEENGDKKTDEASKEEEVKKTEEETNDAENVADEDEDDDDGSDEEDKKEKDLKGMRAFKFALVEVVKELLKPAWKEGKMKKDGYKSIVKKVVEKVTSTMQSGNVPQTQEKIDHYLAASKPKLTKLVQAYISKTKKT